MLILLYLLPQKPIVPTELYRAIRDSQLIGMSGYTREVPISEIMLWHTLLSSFAIDAPRDFITIWECRYPLFQGLPVFAFGAGLSTYDKASVRVIEILIFPLVYKISCAFTCSWTSCWDSSRVFDLWIMEVYSLD